MIAGSGIELAGPLDASGDSGLCRNLNIISVISETGISLCFVYFYHAYDIRVKTVNYPFYARVCVYLNV